MNVYIFFNNRESVIPERSEWEKFEGHDSLRLALFAAESWRRNGWKPIFFNTRGCEGFGTEPWKRLTNHYPREFYNVWFRMADICARTGSRQWFSTIDVFNCGFTPGHAKHLLEDIHGAEGMLKDDALVMQKQTYSYALLNCGVWYATRAIELVQRYDRGDLELPGNQPEFVSDEHVLRHHSRWTTAKAYQMDFPYCSSEWKTAPLLHFARSTLQWPVKEGIV